MQVLDRANTTIIISLSLSTSTSFNNNNNNVPRAGSPSQSCCQAQQMGSYPGHAGQPESKTHHASCPSSQRSLQHSHQNTIHSSPHHDKTPRQGSGIVPGQLYPKSFCNTHTHKGKKKRRCKKRFCVTKEEKKKKSKARKSCCTF